jgi:Lrp/AsnC family transcriptional regulator, regulator for asnA, asnC and gidA
MAQQRGGSAPALTDAVGKRIIELLQRDGRRPFVSIAAEVGLSEGAVRQRVQRLIDTGVMQIVAVTDPLVVGFTRQAMIGIKTQGDVGPVADRLCEIPQIDYVVTTAGSFDLLVEVVCEGDAELLDVLMTQIRTIPEVTHTETFVYLKLNKQHYDWGTR